MSDILKKIDEFNNNHYLNVIKISKNKFLSLKDLYYKRNIMLIIKKYPLSFIISGKGISCFGIIILE